MSDIPSYIYNNSRNDGRYHEVHTTTCGHLPSKENQVDLGWHSNCREAIKEAENRTRNYDFDGCYYCSEDCHKG